MMNPYDVLARVYDQFQNGRDQVLLKEFKQVLQELNLGLDAPSLLADMAKLCPLDRKLHAQDSSLADPALRALTNEKISDSQQGVSEIPLALDLGCGSGRISQLLLEMNWRVWGLDLSLEQIKLADERAFYWEDQKWLTVEDELIERLGEDTYIQKRQELRRFAFQVADLTQYSLAETKADLAVCWLDTFNHLPRESWLSFCQNVARGLRKGGYFIFDYLTPAYMEKYYANQTYANMVAGQKLIWENDYDPRKKRNRAHLQLVSQKQRHQFMISEDALEPLEAEQQLKEAGFAIIWHSPSTYQKERYIICGQKGE